MRGPILQFASECLNSMKRRAADGKLRLTDVASVTCASKLAQSPRQPINLRRNANFVGQSLFFPK